MKLPAEKGGKTTVGALGVLSGEVVWGICLWGMSYKNMSRGNVQQPLTRHLLTGHITIALGKTVLYSEC